MNKLLLLALLYFSISSGQQAWQDSTTDRWVVTQFGAQPGGLADNTAAFQRAIDKAAVKGGRVIIPAGRWLIAGCVRVKPGVCLEGTNDAPLSPYQQTGAVILATGGRDNENGDPLFEMWNASCATGFTIYYPEQSVTDVHPYSWTFYIRNPPVVHSDSEKRTEDFDVTIQNITLINSYNGIRCGPDENGRHRILSVHGCVLRRGIMVDWTGDIGRIENVQFHCHYWFHPAFKGDWNAVFQYMQHHLEAFIFGRTDWEYVTNTFVFPAKIGYKFIATPNGMCNGQFSGIGADATETCIVAEAIQSQGLQITNGEFNTHHEGSSTQVVVDKSCSGSIRFTNCGFWGPAEHNATIEGDGFVSFQNCFFSTNLVDTLHPNYSIVAEAGKLQVNNCTFDGTQTDEVAQWTYGGTKKRPPCIYLKKGLRHAIISGNNGFHGVQIKNEIGNKAIIKDNEPEGQ